jgi:Arc/MetJ-type ribon-helix-helix transcriptional regulator
MNLGGDLRKGAALLIQLPEGLENSLRAEVASGRFASLDDAVAEAVRRLIKDGSPVTPASGTAVVHAPNPVIGALRDAADELDEIVEDAIRRRSEGWRDIPIE